MTPDQAIAAAEFIAWAMMDGPWEGDDLDGADVQEKAAKLGLLVLTQYDPEKHGESEFDVEPGADWYMLAPWLTEILRSAVPSPQSGSEA